MTDTEFAEQVIRNVQTIVDNHNFDMTRDGRDDYDKGEASGIRRALRLLGFAIEYDEDRTIKAVDLPEYMKNGLGC